ncbi:CYP3A4 [Bugula neritina]|uniref:CYP3A4 n=1 Tax=Bugula neritina TaxID=10212 RepID=A0A7J7KBC3_BUGNE|nr:CYP3A4 [Bugula neritina]
MNIFGWDVPLWVSLTAIVITLLYWYGTATYGYFKSRGVPYKPAYIPFLGDVIEYLTVPHTIIQRRTMKRYPGKVYGTFQGRTPVLQVANAEFVKEITIKEFSSFTNRRDLVDEDSIAGNHIGMIRDDHWKHVRSLLSPTFTSGKLKQMYSVIQGCSDKFVKHLKSTQAEPIAIKNYTAGYTMDVIASTAFGLDIDSQERTDHPFIYHAKSFFFRPKDDRFSSKLSSFLGIVILLLCPKTLKRILARFVDVSFLGAETMEYFGNILNTVFSQTQSQLEKRKDFISMCSDKVVDLDKVDKDSIKVTNGKRWTTEGLSKRDVLANAAIFISAGYETTGSTLEYFFYIMAVHPEIQHKLHTLIAEVVDENGECPYEDLKKLEYLDWCIDETMRMFSIATRLEREAKTDITVKGIPISKGDGVQIQIHALHYDPDYWTDPEKFNPDRFAPEKPD